LNAGDCVGVIKRWENKMSNADGMAAAFITFLQALDDDGRINANDAEFLTAYATKLGAGPTDGREDAKILHILKKWLIKVI